MASLIRAQHDHDLPKIAKTKNVTLEGEYECWKGCAAI